jgi:hypothetical protein
VGTQLVLRLAAGLDEFDRPAHRQEVAAVTPLSVSSLRNRVSGLNQNPVAGFMPRDPATMTVAFT